MGGYVHYTNYRAILQIAPTAFAISNHNAKRSVIAQNRKEESMKLYLAGMYKEFE